MKRTTQFIRAMIAAAAAILIVAHDGAAQIPHYTNGMTGTFGTPETWSFNSQVMSLDQTTDEYSARFTSMENLSVAQAWQRLTGIDAGTTVRVGIMADNGSGNPSGTYLAFGDMAFTTAFSGVTNVNFSSAASLASGATYHLVTRVIALPATQSFEIRGGGDFSVRPYDRAVDTNMNSMTRNNAGAWTSVAFDPYFALGDGSTVVSGPGQPYSSQGNNTGLLRARGGTSQSNGEQFTLTSKEIPVGASVAFSSVTLNAVASGTPTDPLIIRFRKLDGTILGMTTMLPVQATGVNITLALDKQVELQEGFSYLLTTEFGGTGGTTAHFYSLGTQRTDGGFETGSASWGGMNISFPVLSGANNNWATFSPDTTKANLDLYFSFQGIVVPEPSVAALVALGSLALLWHRRSR